MAGPEISVVVPSHGRRLRLWWLLDALGEQTLAPDRFEVLVVHDYPPEVTATLERHHLVQGGIARLLSIDPGTGNPARQRNIGWRSARASLIAFTDDDCRPAPRWLETLLEAAVGAPQSIVQGTTRPDPLEEAIFAAPHYRTLHVDPPNVFAQTCNIAYPRSLLERVGGFDERLPTAAGEDTDLALRAKATGAEHIGVRGALVYHAIESFSLPQALRLSLKWQHLPYVYRRHPELRRTSSGWLFWRPTHAELALAAVGVAVARRNRLAVLAALPYVRRALRKRGTSKRSRLASLVELPGRVAVDGAEILTLAVGSVRHRTPLL